ncbi:MAG: hypothetical protein OCD76_22915 [Reichenbachiella sp.]
MYQTSKITLLLLLLIFTISSAWSDDNLSLSIELLRDYAVTAEEQIFENTILIEKSISDVTIGFENIFAGTGSVHSNNSDELNLSIGYTVQEHLSLSALQRFIITDDSGITSTLSGGGIAAITFETFASVSDENEITFAYENDTWEYVNTFLVEKEFYSTKIFTITSGIENELIITKEDAAVNSTLLFTTLGYKSMGLTAGYILETAPSTAHSIEFGLTLTL